MQRVTYFLVLSILVGGAASAQQSEKPAAKSPEEIREIKERVGDWLKTRLTDWDRATHMTATEWRTTCNRVAAERTKFLLEEPGAMPVSSKTRPR